MFGWKTKAFIQGTLSRLPNGKACNQAIQRYVTKSLVLDRDKFRAKLEFGRGHLRNLIRFQRKTPKFRVLELGTGRFPIVPLYLFLCGAEKIVSLDIVPLLRDDTVRQTLRMYAEDIASGYLPETDEKRVEQFQSVLAEGAGKLGKEALRRFNIDTVVCDTRYSGLAVQSFDLLTSNTTLEHIPRETLLEVLKHLRSLAHPDGLMSHYIDLRDHYAEWDRSINVYNFLRYSNRRWRWFNNSLLYQSRLRVSDYRNLHAAADWELLAEEDDPGSVSDMQTIPLAPEFQSYSEQELLVPTCWMVSQPSGMGYLRKPQTWSELTGAGLDQL